MKIAITADPFLPVPPLLYGGIERIIALLIDELISRGHDLTLFAHRDSQVPCRLLAYPGHGHGRRDTLRNTRLIYQGITAGRFDLVHSFGRLAYLLPLFPNRIPKLMSYQREPTLSQIRRAAWLSSRNTLEFTGCSNYISNQIKPFAPAHTVYNGVDLTKYEASTAVADDGPLIFLGRIEPIKGTHTAIETALKTGRRLRIAGNIPAEHQSYFDTQVKPFLGPQIEYLGPVNDEQKAVLLRQGSALLMPIHWNEPFGIVMIEAMATGTPVIGFNRGAVPEVVQHGRNGFVAETADEMASFVHRIGTIDRRAVRASVEEKFSAAVISGQYLNIYQDLIHQAHGKKRK